MTLTVNHIKKANKFGVIDVQSVNNETPDADGVITGEIEAPEKKENPFA